MRTKFRLEMTAGAAFEFESTSKACSISCCVMGIGDDPIQPRIIFAFRRKAGEDWLIRASIR